MGGSLVVAVVRCVVGRCEGMLRSLMSPSLLPTRTHLTMLVVVLVVVYVWG